MNDEMNDNSIQHYASKYYDPVKAHEYYMRTRELKGRRSTSKLSDAGKKAWAYTKNEIGLEKKAKAGAAKAERDQAVRALRERASEVRASITERLKTLNSALAEGGKSEKEAIESVRKSSLEDIEKRSAAERDKIASKASSEIKRLMAVPIPDDLPKEERARVIAERNAEIEKLREGAKSEKSKISETSKLDSERVRSDAGARKQQVSEETKEQRKVYSGDASSERKRAASELKGAISAAREAYQAARSSLNSSYEEIYQREFDKIAAKMPHVSKRNKKSTSRTSRKPFRK